MKRRSRLWAAVRKRFHEVYVNISLRNIIMISFTATAILAAALIGISFYGRISSQFKLKVQEENQSLIEQVNSTLSSHLRSMMRVSDTLYYSVIKNSNLRTDHVTDQFLLLYDTNKVSIENIALYNSSGVLLEVAPASISKDYITITEQEWFISALDRTENLHFVGPRVQNLFVSKEEGYSWVVSLSRAVQFNYGTRVAQGVLLVDMGYIGIEEILGGANMGGGGYLYLIDNAGEIIYHPKLQLIGSGLVKENNLVAAGYRDGNYEEEFEGEQRTITVKSVGYTGWRIIGVTPQRGLALSTLKSGIFYLFLALFFVTVLILLNAIISAKVSRPILEMEAAVKKVEEGNLSTEIRAEGYLEVRHLGTAIQNMTARIRQLMQDIVAEHESKRKTELDTLQSQINPHFLYNTLDIIVWMIENERKAEAVQVVTALARFFRISLSRGKTIIPVSDELAHVESYLTIQNMRFKNRFVYSIHSDEEVGRLSVVKLVLQPLVENAIYHGMEYMDGDGEIEIRVSRMGDELRLTVTDNGPGMLPKVSESLLEREYTSSSRGSGIGVKNVHQRIRLTYGEPYGLDIQSTPDSGTTVTMRLPAIPYDKEAANQ